MRAGRSYKNIDHMDKIKITKYFNYNVRFNGFISRDNLPKIRDGPYAINLDDKLTKGTHWVSICIDRNTALYFFWGGIEYISQEVSQKIKDKSITHNIPGMESDGSIVSDFVVVLS